MYLNFMKWIAFVLCLLFSLSALAQTRVEATSQPPKQARTILIKSALADANLYREMGRTLVENGYDLELTDPSLFFIRTTLKPLTVCSHRVTAIVHKGTIRLTGQFVNETMQTAFKSDKPTPTENVGEKGSVFFTAFNELNAISQKVAAAVNGKIEYRLN